MAGHKVAKVALSVTMGPVVAGLVLAASALAQETAPSTPPATATAPAGPPFQFSALNTTITVMPDGSYRQIVHTEIQVLNPAVVNQLAQFPVGYDEAMQTLDISGAYTQKSDGRKEQVAPGAIIIRSAPTANIMLTTAKQKVIVFPDVAAGDTMVYDAVYTGKPQIPGLYSSNAIFPRTAVVAGGEYRIVAPKSLALYLDAMQVTPQKSETADTVTYSVSYSNPTAVNLEANPFSTFDQGPRLSISNFKDYEALVAAYTPMIRPKMEVTPDIQKAADGIVAGTSDKREQARKIYDWINAHVRYVAISMGTGGVVPHDAASVMANGYGDCKDQAVLLVALLKAEKIDAYPVLIHSGNTYQVTKFPTVGSFDHVIVWLPRFSLYADTTSAGLVPFGDLPLDQYGKWVTVIGDGGKGLRQIPTPKSDDASFTYTLDAKFDEAGHDDSTSSLTATGRFVEPLKVIGRALQQDTAGKIAASMFQQRGNARAQGGFTAPPDIGAEPYKVAAAYKTGGTLIPYTQNRPFPIPDALRLVPLLSSVFFGPIFDDKFKNADAIPCRSGKGIDDETLEFVASRKLSKLPDDKKISTTHMTYASHWSQEAGKVHVHRELETNFDQAVCTNPVKVLSVAQSIKADIAVQIALTKAE